MKKYFSSCSHNLIKPLTMKHTVIQSSDYLLYSNTTRDNLYLNEILFVESYCHTY